MSYTKTVWKDYPDTSTLMSAALLNKMEDGIAQGVSSAAAAHDYLLYALNGLFPRRTSTDVSAQGLYSYRIPRSQYDPSNDGLLIWLKTTDSDEFDVLLGVNLDYGVTEDGGDVVVTFGALDVPAAKRDKFRFTIYKYTTTAAASLTYGTTVGMSVGMTSAYQGTSEEVTD